MPIHWLVNKCKQKNGITTTVTLGVNECLVGMGILAERYAVDNLSLGPRAIYERVAREKEVCPGR